VTFSSIDLSSKQFDTVVIRGNLTIDTNIDKDIGIMVIKGKDENAGNIIVKDNVSMIHASIFAEGIFR
jgi:hypothetical protein